MKKHIFAVCDTEAEYARNFMDYISRRKNIPFEIQVFTTAEGFLDFARKNHVELLLISQDAMCREIRDLDIGKVIVLTEGVRPSEPGAYDSVYKYQSTAQVIREVMACYGETRSVLPMQAAAMKKTTEILGVYSPLGRCLKTSFALTLGQILARDRAVLYVNMEEYSGFEELFHRSYQGTLSDLLYYIRQGENGFPAKISSMVETAGSLDYIPPVRSPLDIRGTSWEEWSLLLQEIVLHSSYETVILDIGNGIDEIFRLLDMCSTVFMPVRTDRISVCKTTRFENLLKALDYPQVLARTVKMRLPFCGSVQKGVFHPEELVWSELGDYVRELIRKEGL